MKKIFLSMLFLLFCLLQTHSVSAHEYLTYQEMNFERYGGKLLIDYNASDYERAYQRLGSRRFFGWRTYTLHHQEPVSFQKETLYVITNTGHSPITKTYFLRTTEQEKYQISATGNIGITTSGDVRAFRLGLDAQVRPSISKETQRTEEERMEVRIQVDPYAQLKVEVYGEGYLSNGVGRYYAFWINMRSGGWETFVLTTEYFSIVKEQYRR